MLKKIMITLGIILGIFLIFNLIFFIDFNRMSQITKGKPISDYSKPKTALVIIDIQKNITDKNAKLLLNLKQTDQIIENTNKIIDNSKRLDLILIYITNEVKKYTFGNFISRGALEEGSEGAKLDPRIKVINNNHFIKYQMDSFTNKDFENFLINNQINHLIITGLDAGYCVDRTIKAALNRNYKVTVISDGIATNTDKKREIKINEFKKLGVNILTTKELLKH